MFPTKVLDALKAFTQAFLGDFPCNLRNLCQSGPFCWRLDSAIHWINHTEVDNSIGFDSTYPVNSDLCGHTKVGWEIFTKSYNSASSLLGW